jgi:choline dehydrogenase
LLQRLGIPIVAHSEEVGENLQDHYQARVIVKLRKKHSLNDDVRWPSRWACLYRICREWSSRCSVQCHAFVG